MREGEDSGAWEVSTGAGDDVEGGAFSLTTGNRDSLGVLAEVCVGG